MYVSHIQQDLDEKRMLRDLVNGPNDAVRSHKDLWSINREREANGQRAISPPMSFRRGYPRIPSLQWNQEHGFGGWTIGRNAKLKPKRIARQPKRRMR